MEKLIYVSALRINAKVSEIVVPGYPIVIDGYTYERVSRAPLGRRKLRTLISQDSQEKLVIYS